MNLRFAYFFPSTLSAPALKASLAEVRGLCIIIQHHHHHYPIILSYIHPHLSPSIHIQVLSKFPILAGRQRRKGKRHWIDSKGQGVLVREQRAKVYGDDATMNDDSFMKAHIDRLEVGRCVCM